jgi:autophagy-related protein 9
MSNSRLLSSHYSDDDEYTLDAVHDRSSYTAHRFDFAPRDRSISSNGEDEEEDTLEAPSSLMIERHTSPTEQQSTREHVSVYDRTMWRWANVENMDDFFQRVYDYFQGKGLYCILLARLLNLMQVFLCYYL